MGGTDGPPFPVSKGALACLRLKYSGNCGQLYAAHNSRERQFNSLATNHST